MGCAKHLCTLALGRPLGVAILCKLQHEGFVGPHSLVCFPCWHPKGVHSEHMNSEDLMRGRYYPRMNGVRRLRNAFTTTLAFY